MKIVRFALVSGVLVAFSCHDLDGRFGLGAACNGDASCRSPYVCRLGLCRSPCSVDRDCPGGACLVLDEHTRVCTVAAEQDCKRTDAAVCAKGLTCGVDAVCRSACDEKHRCLGGLDCVERACYAEALRGGVPDASSADPGHISRRLRDASAPDEATNGSNGTTNGSNGATNGSADARPPLRDSESDKGVRSMTPDGGTSSVLDASGFTRDASAVTTPDATAIPPLPPFDAGGVVPTLRGNVIKVPLAAQAFVADPLRHRLYVTTPNAAAAFPSRLVTIDPASGQILHAVQIGDNPTVLALSDDSSTLWVGLKGTYEVRKVDLTARTPTPGPSYSVPLAGSGDVVGSMVVLTGTRNSVAVSLHDTVQSNTFRAAAVLDDGIARPQQLGVTSGASMLFAGPAGYIFASGTSFYTVAVDSSGLSAKLSRSGLLGGDPAAVLDADGFIYSSGGTVIDVRDPAAPRPMGAFAYSGAVAPLPDSDAAVMLTSDDPSVKSPATLHVLDAATFTQASSKGVGTIGETFDSIGPALYVQASTVAFLEQSLPPTFSPENLYLVHDDFSVHAKAPTAAAPFRNGDFIEVPVQASALAPDIARHRVYVTVPASADNYQNRLLTLSATDGTVVGSTPIGSDPTALALSVDGSTLWVALGGSCELRKVDLTTALPTPGPAHSFPLRGAGDTFAITYSLVGLPGSPGSIVAAMWSKPTASSAGVVVLDDGIARRQQGPQSSGPLQLVRGPSGVVFGWEENQFFSLAIDATGVAQTTPPPSVFPTIGAESGAYDGAGFVYLETGDVVDVSNPTAVKRVGTFPYQGGVLPIGNGTLLMLSNGAAPDPPIVLRTLNRATLGQTSARALTGQLGSFGSGLDIQRIGTGKVAFISWATGVPGKPEHPAVYFLSDPAIP
jgi:hypothetical protein